MTRSGQSKSRAPGRGSSRAQDKTPSAPAQGDAVVAVGRPLFRACDFGTGVTSVTVEAASAGAEGEATVELHLADGTPHWPPPPSRPPAALRLHQHPRPLPEPPTGVHDLHITLRGALRLACLGFSG